MNTRIAVMVCGALLASTVSAAAQTWDDRLFINISGGVQAGSSTSTLDLAPVVYDEPASLTVRRKVDGRGLFDLSAGRPISGNFGVAVSFSARSSKDNGDVSASVPDPIFFDRPRDVSDSISDMKHSERWLGIHAAWFLVVGEKLDLILLAGPAIAMVDHEVPTGLTVTETGATPTVTTTVETRGKSFAGYQIGADLRYMITDMVGVGGFARYSGAKGKILGDSELELGGFQIGAGLRLKF